MTDLPDLTPEVRDAIARLCGGVSKTGSGPVEWWFPMRDGATCDRFDGSINIPAHQWLSLKGEPGDDLWIAVQESILLRGLVRAGVLGHANAPQFFAAIGGEKGFWKDGPQTPIAYMVALAAAHIEARKEGGK